MTNPGERTLPGVTDLEALFRQHANRVYAYARRHVGADAADDVVSDTFLVAWRRRDNVPDDALPWLLVCARNIIANTKRSDRRRDQLWWSAVDEFWHADDATDPQEAAVAKEAQLDGLRSCTPSEREALLLIAWDGLSIDDAARVAGCSSRAFTVRLSRARARMRHATTADGNSLAPKADRPALSLSHRPTAEDLR